MEKDIAQIKRRLKRSKIAIFVIIGFLVLATYLLIIASQQASEQAFVYKTEATSATELDNIEVIGGDQVINAAVTELGFEYGGAYASYNPQGPAIIGDPAGEPCAISIEQCRYASDLFENDLEAFAALIDRVSREFRNAYGPRGHCGYSYNDVGFASINCWSWSSCPGARPLIEKLINLACKSPEQREAEGIIIEEPSAKRYCPATTERQGADRSFGTKHECKITCGDHDPIIKFNAGGWTKEACAAETFHTCGCIQ